MAAPSECGFCTVRAGDKAERSEVWVTDNERRAKRGVGNAMLVHIKRAALSDCIQIQILCLSGTKTSAGGCFISEAGQKRFCFNKEIEVTCV